MLYRDCIGVTSPDSPLRSSKLGLTQGLGSLVLGLEFMAKSKGVRPSDSRV